LARSVGTITASGRSSDDSGYYVINNSTIAAASGQSVTSGSYYLGRPWRDYARVIFQLTSMTDVINSAGWEEW
jgi:pectinesterase